MRKLSRYDIPVERLEPQCDNEKSFLQMRIEKKITFEDDMPNIKTKTNNDLLTQTI